MPHYALVMSWTEAGLARLVPAQEDQSGATLTALEEGLTQKLSAENGGLLSIHWTLGASDVLAIVEADSELVVAGIALYLSQEHGVRATTMRAFTTAEMRGDGDTPGVAQVNYRCHY